MKAFKIPTKQRYLSPREYLKEIQDIQQCENVEQVQFVPPTVGKPGFGKFLVKYKRHVLV